MNRIALAGLAAALALAVLPAAQAQGKFSDNVIRIGIMNDRTGPYSELSGEGSVVAARMAVEEFGGKVLGVPVEIVVADHQNKTDLGASIAKKWFDADGVDAIFDVSQSAVSLAIAAMVKDRHKIVVHNSGAAALTGKACSPRSIQYMYNIAATASNMVTAQDVKNGLDSFFIISVDYAAGQDNARLFRQAVAKAGGKVLGEVKTPVNTTDYSSYLMQAQASGAKGIFIADAGAGFVNAAKQAVEFGITPKQTLVAQSIMASEAQAAGLDVLQNIRSVSFYEWNLNDATRAWAKQFAARTGGRTPSGPHAATYSAVRHYLQAIQAAGTDESDAVLAKMRELPVRDAFTPNGRVREDGQLVHDMYVFRVKNPAESGGKGDFSQVLQTVPAQQAFAPLAQSECPYVQK